MEKGAIGGIMKNIVIFGATGKTGRPLLQQALDAGYKVTAVARTPENLSEFKKYENFECRKGNVLDRNTFQDCMAGCDAVMSCLGPSSYVSIFQTVNLYTDSMVEIHEAMKIHGISRFVAMTAWGTQDSPTIPFFTRWIFFPLFLRSYLSNMNQMEQYLKKSELNYTVCRPPGLTDEPSSGKEVMYEVDAQALPNACSRMPRADVTSFMLKSLLTGQFDRKFVGIGVAK